MDAIEAYSHDVIVNAAHSSQSCNSIKYFCLFPPGLTALYLQYLLNFCTEIYWMGSQIYHSLAVLF